MLATGGSACAALATLKAWGVPRIKLLSVIASRAGLDRVWTNFPETKVHVCAVDPLLDDRKFIVPGLGDAGDRSFNTLRE
jgi:uracil phosphoribosyltransferase